MKVVEMWVGCHAANGSVFSVMGATWARVPVVWAARHTSAHTQRSHSGKNTLWPWKNNTLASKH